MHRGKWERAEENKARDVSEDVKNMGISGWEIKAFEGQAEACFLAMKWLRSKWSKLKQSL